MPVSYNPILVKLKFLVRITSPLMKLKGRWRLPLHALPLFSRTNILLG